MTQAAEIVAFWREAGPKRWSASAIHSNGCPLSVPPTPDERIFVG